MNLRRDFTSKYNYLDVARVRIIAHYKTLSYVRYSQRCKNIFSGIDTRIIAYHTFIIPMYS